MPYPLYAAEGLAAERGLLAALKADPTTRGVLPAWSRDDGAAPANVRVEPKPAPWLFLLTKGRICKRELHATGFVSSKRV